MLKNVFVFVESQEKTTYGIGFKLALTRNENESGLDKAVRIADPRTEIHHTHWYVTHYTPSIPQEELLPEQILSKTPTVHPHFERSVFMKEVKNQSLWFFELSSHESMKFSIWKNIDFQQRNRQDSQGLNNDISCRLPVTSAQCNTRTEKNSEASILLNYDDDEYLQGYGEIKEACRAFRER